jgi:hypothetical protein
MAEVIEPRALGHKVMEILCNQDHIRIRQRVNAGVGVVRMLVSSTAQMGLRSVAHWMSVGMMSRVGWMIVIGLLREQR